MYHNYYINPPTVIFNMSSYHAYDEHTSSPKSPETSILYSQDNFYTQVDKRIEQNRIF